MEHSQPTSAPGKQTLLSEPSVLRSVFQAIFVETVKDFVVNIFGFFRKYVKHYRDIFSYLWNPSFKNPRLIGKNWQENAQHSFELAILVVVAIIFMVKMEWIPKGDQIVMEMLSNDLSQMAIEIGLFFAFAITFILSACLSIITGRVLRFMFEIPLTKHQSDILFTYLNNLSFSLMLIFIFIFRCSFSLLSMKDESSNTLTAMWAMLFLLLLPLLIFWCIRFSKKNSLYGGKAFLFTFIFSIPLTIMFSFFTMFLAAFLFNI